MGGARGGAPMRAVVATPEPRLTADGDSVANASEIDAMRRAVDLARSPGVPLGPNPRVGCVLLDVDGTVIGTGFHRGAGTPHAEVAALASAGELAIGATAVVSLEPCNHTGRTGPCTRALIDAGIARVVFAQADPNPVAAGGAEELRRAGIDVAGGLLAAEAEELNRIWSIAIGRGRPFVTWKTAATLDGRVAAADGSSRWITSAEARSEVHVLRDEVDAVLVGTGTVLADDPALTSRSADGSLRSRQPIRAVMGLREIPAAAAVLNTAAPTMHLRTRDPQAALASLFTADVQHVLLEGGPTLAAQFVRAGLVDRVIWYVAPALLGQGASALPDIGIGNIDAALRLRVLEVNRVGPDIRIDADFQWED